MNIKQLQAKLRRLEKRIERQSAEIEQMAAESSADMIRDRTSRGFGVDKHKAPKKRLKALSDGYKATRKREGLSGKSRLTRTGELLSSIKAFRGKVILDGKRNKEIAKYVAMGGRSFFHLSSAEYKKLVIEIRARIKKILRS